MGMETTLVCACHLAPWRTTWAAASLTVLRNSLDYANVNTSITVVVIVATTVLATTVVVVAVVVLITVVASRPCRFDCRQIWLALAHVWSDLMPLTSGRPHLAPPR
uniref:Uncharacterized protein n=1 Tax=Oryza barthii TaxID=65489 RepID=A0A0D3FL61_9ORYZ